MCIHTHTHTQSTLEQHVCKLRGSSHLGFFFELTCVVQLTYTVETHLVQGSAPRGGLECSEQIFDLRGRLVLLNPKLFKSHLYLKSYINA